jgi:hypothetical protein
MAGKVIFLPDSTLEIALRIGGLIVGGALAVVTAVWEAVLTPWYVVVSGHVLRLPVAPLLAMVVNLGLVWFTSRVTGRVVLGLLPGIAWIVVMFAAGDLTSDGDLIVEGTWVGLSTILLGALAFAVGGYVIGGRMTKRAALDAAEAAPVPAAVPAPAGPARPGGAPRPGARKRTKR